MNVICNFNAWSTYKNIPLSNAHNNLSAEMQNNLYNETYTDDEDVTSCHE